jgi:hypothetical protein
MIGTLNFHSNVNRRPTNDELRTTARSRSSPYQESCRETKGVRANADSLPIMPLWTQPPASREASECVCERSKTRRSSWFLFPRHYDPPRASAPRLCRRSDRPRPTLFLPGIGVSASDGERLQRQCRLRSSPREARLSAGRSYPAHRLHRRRALRRARLRPHRRGVHSTISTTIPSGAHAYIQSAMSIGKLMQP